MKISKLFHWLYAVLMLLPVAFIAVRCGYVMFNKNAKDSYSGISTQEQIIYTPITEISEMVEGNWYNFNTDNQLYVSGSAYLFFTDLEVLQANAVIPSTTSCFRFTAYSTNSYIRIYYYAPDMTLLGDNVINIANSNFNINFQYSHFANTSDFDNFKQYFRKYTLYQGVNTLDNVFDYSVNQLNEVPLFSWAKDSFLVAPFSYITGLFGLVNTSPINTLLSYWLSISIIWLVFDLVMYLPLLVHRWLDKGVLE